MPPGKRPCLPGGIRVCFLIYRFQRWLVPPWQAQSWTRAPLAAEAPATSRHNPDCAFVIEPFAFTFHR
ncbi:hypothetical protein SAMN05216270_1241 [Glycomyces harbinensis]|uniref:Uncharacterized protein n=1 Tax=Glycomyces harbinensis TaxID=58114 RepID=A0A1G7DBG2_9ACTN|nr:hypothetical protein SAMN05216270_1241 [Glycomyces harbinensis]